MSKSTKDSLITTKAKIISIQTYDVLIIYGGRKLLIPKSSFPKNIVPQDIIEIKFDFEKRFIAFTLLTEEEK